MYQGAGVVASSSPAVFFKIVPRTDLGEFSIENTDEQLVYSLSSATGSTQVALQNAHANDDSQDWLFYPA
ncbi:hypothetical protein K503DRAFT_802130 [Rhizopogon vinicolor AM-OR11-026]|uniref:Ricin B lectin domain-containing protein n=1 Tax=Rhizopogon vinicolor AM-OR11-026 TaxID=1314800 RepID=A0A1B7MUN5_9AGAM|nr:hypothetical protein K503DRAFT_802130 [Rhizopogon vinicolor AM-OR11-026]